MAGLRLRRCAPPLCYGGGGLWQKKKSRLPPNGILKPLLLLRVSPSRAIWLSADTEVWPKSFRRASDTLAER
jgi:hypothetical protein